MFSLICRDGAELMIPIHIVNAIEEEQIYLLKQTFVMHPKVRLMYFVHYLLLQFDGKTIFSHTFMLLSPY